MQFAHFTKVEYYDPNTGKPESTYPMRIRKDVVYAVKELNGMSVLVTIDGHRHIVTEPPDEVEKRLS